MNKKKLYLIHGFNVSDDGADTIDKLRPYLEKQYDVIDIDYGWNFRMRVRFCNENYARIIASMIEPDSYAIGHSNGCTLLHMATHHGAKIKRMVYINPALDNDLTPSDYVDKCFIWYSKNDKVVWYSKWIPGSEWGNMGQVGYTGDDPRMINNDAQEYTNREIEHSNIFSNLDIYADEMKKQLLSK